MEKYDVLVHSPVDGVVLPTTIFKEESCEKTRAIMVMVHGMCEHKERYFDFCEFLAKEGHICVVYDQRGHGQAALDSDTLGYYSGRGKDPYLLAEDLQGVVSYAKQNYPDLPTYVFGHSMGSLVARMYFAKYGRHIYKLILCGIPTYNSLAGTGMKLVKLLMKLKGDQYRSDFVKGMAMGAFNKGIEEQNGWLSYNKENVEAYNADKLCGFTFTLDAFYNLFAMIDKVYIAKDYEKVNKDAAILIIAGEDDPVIESQYKFLKTVSFYKRMGVRKVKHKLFEHMRHEILHEDGNYTVKKTILDFLMGNM